MPAEGAPAERFSGALRGRGLEPPLSAEDSVAVALPGSMVATHLVTLPFTDPKRIEQVLPAEVEGAIPFDLADVVWDYAILGQAVGKTDGLVGIVQKAVLKRHLNALAAARIAPSVATP